MAERRTAETPVVSTVHHPFGNPAGPGLWHHQGLQLPAYIQNVAHAFTRKGVPESEAIARAVGVVRDWAEGRAPGGGHVHPDVQAAAAKAIAEWEAMKAAAHASSGRSAAVAHDIEYRAPVKAPYGDVSYGDPGYLDADGNQASKSGKPGVKRYPLTASKVKAAWSYINQAKNAGQYTSAQLSAIKGRIKAAMSEHGHEVSSDTGADDEGTRAMRDQAERRITPAAMEVRMADGGAAHIGGYAAVFGKLSRNLGGFVELVGTTAFNQSRQLGWPGVKCRLNHDKNQLLGTTEGRTLACRTDNIGLDYEVEPPPSMRNVVEWVQRGDISTSSFAFNCPPGGDEWRTSDQGYPLRILHEVQLLDVAPVTGDEAYADATVGLRSLAVAMDAPFEEVRQLAAEDELRRFFTRTDNHGPAKPKPPAVTGPAAMMRLMEKRRDPWADQDV